MYCYVNIKKKNRIEKISVCTIFLSFFFHAWKPNMWNTPTAVSWGIFVFSSSAILVSLLYAVPLRSPFPHLGALLSKICTRYFRHSSRVRSKAQNKGKKKYSTDRKRDLPLRFRAFLTITRGWFFAPGFPDFSSRFLYDEDC